MQVLGRSFNYTHHKYYLLASFVAAVVVTYALLIYSFVALEGITKAISAYLTLVYIASVMLGGAHLVLTCAFLYLLINVKVRFCMLNQFLRYVNFTIAAGIAEL